MEAIGEGIKRVQQELQRLKELSLDAQTAVQADSILLHQAEQIAAIRRSAVYISQLDLLGDIATKLTETRNLKQLAKDILEGAQKLIPFTDGAIGLIDEGVIAFPYAIGRSDKDVMEFKIPIGEGLTGWAVEHKKPVRLGDVRKDPRYKAQISTTKSEMDIPIIYADESVGVINIESDDENAFSEDDERLLAALAEHAAIAINNTRLFNEINALREIDQQLASTLNPTEILELILTTTSNLVKCREVSVGRVDPVTNKIHFTTAVGNFKDEVLEYVASVDTGLCGWAIREKKPVRVGDVTKDHRYEALITNTRSELDVPLLLGDEVIGVLNAESSNFNAFTQHDEDLLVALASQAALAIRNSGEYQKITDDLVAAETMTAIGDVAGSIVHRMNNYVGIIRTRVIQIDKILVNNPSISVDNQTFEALAKRAQIIYDMAEKVLSDVRTFREQFQFNEVKPGFVKVNDIISACLQDMQKDGQIPSGIAVLEELADDLSEFWGVDVHLREIIRNLVSNAVHAMPSGGKLWIKSQQEGSRIKIRVKDTGIGVSDKNRPYIFNRGFTTKKEGQQGLGYGLWWVKTYLKRNKGDLILEETKPGTGSTFVVTLPVRKVNG